MKTNYNIITRYRNKKNQPDSLRILQMIKLFAKSLPICIHLSQISVANWLQKVKQTKSFLPLKLFMESCHFFPIFFINNMI